MNIKTRCQASRCLSESTESQTFSGRHRQNPRAACPRRRPRIASALSAQATPRRSAPSSRQRPPALSRTPFSRCLGLSSSQQQPPSSQSPAVAVANANSPSLLLHPGNASTSAPATHCLLPCSLTELGKPQRRATPRRNSSATLRHRGPADSDHRMPRLSAQ